jgi:hypothetical protein
MRSGSSSPSGSRACPSASRSAPRGSPRSEERPVSNVEAEVTRLLADADLPARHAPAILDAYRHEPLPNAFGISQAATLAAQSFTPEDRLELEQAAGNYLAALN